MSVTLPSVDYLWTPWRYTYVTSADKAAGCVFCDLQRQKDDEQALIAMHTIAAMGVRFAIDDFGVGFSSISYLQDLPAHVVKTDAALAQNIDRDERACAVLRAVTVMAKSLGLDVVIEGVERPGQLAAVRDSVDAPFVQGYLLHRPMSYEALLATVRENRRRAAHGPENDEVLVPSA